MTACNGKSALQQSQRQEEVNPNIMHYNIIGAICNLQQIIPISFKFEHIKGHQDGRVVTTLPRIAWMNIKMDLRAKQAIQTEFQGPRTYQIPGEGWICYIKQYRVIKNLQNKLWHHINSIAIQEHWEQKGRFSRGHTHVVD